MKNRTDQILLAVTIIAAAIYLVLLLLWLEVIPCPFPPYHLAWLGVSFHVIPAFCIQLLLCRRAKRRAVRLLPVLTVLALTAVIFGNFAAASGWDNLGWLILLCLCIAPAVGCVLGWAVYCFHQLYKRGKAQ